jgi:hypothetical protein
MTWAMGGILAFGVFGLIHGIRIRAGESRTFYPRYPTHYMYRNGPFTLIPGGIWLIAGAGTIIASHHDAGVVVAVLAPITLVALVLSVVWLFKPPDFMKPRWLREVESGAAPEPATGVYGAASATGARRIYLPPVVYWGLWIATAVIFALFLAFDWSPSVLVGLGAGVSLLAAHTPKKA